MAAQGKRPWRYFLDGGGNVAYGDVVQAMALNQWSACYCGAPNTSMTASPRFLSTMPLLISQACVIRVK